MLNVYLYFDDAEDLDNFDNDENRIVEYLIKKTNMYKDKSFRFKPSTIKLLGKFPNTAVIYALIIAGERIPDAEEDIKKNDLAWKNYINRFPEAK
jgi:hypothetical protein